MQFTNKFINVDAHVEAKQQPVYLMNLEPGKEYHTATSSLLEDDITWSTVREGMKVRIPVFAYRTPAGLPPENFNVSIWGLGLQCGMLALSASDKEPESVMLVFGDKSHECEDGGYRVYLGLTMVGKKNG